MRVRHGLVAAAIAATAIAAAGSVDAYEFPSTNDANREADLPHVNQVSTGPGTITLEFVNETNSLAFFEYRIDGATVGTDPHPVVIGDVIHPGECVDGRVAPACAAGPVELELSALATVEVRLALGGERNWDFDWTPFAVGPIERRDCRRGGFADLGFTNRGQCIRFVETGFDIRDPEAMPRDPLERRECRNGGWADYGFERARDCRRFVTTGVDPRV